MAIIKLQRPFPPLFQKLSGKLGGIEFRTRKNRKIEISARRLPKQPLTEAQQAVRKEYGQIYQEWVNLPPEQKEEYNKLGAARGWSGWNYFFWLKKQGTWFKVDIDCSDLASNLTNYILPINVALNADLLAALNDTLANCKVFDSDKETELTTVRALTKLESPTPFLLVQIPELTAGETKTIWIHVANKYSEPTGAVTNFTATFADEFDDFNWSKWDSVDASKTVQDSKLTLKFTADWGGIITTDYFAKPIRAILKITNVNIASGDIFAGFANQFYAPCDDPDQSEGSKGALLSPDLGIAAFDITIPSCCYYTNQYSINYPLLIELIWLTDEITVRANYDTQMRLTSDCAWLDWDKKLAIIGQTNNEITIDFVVLHECNTYIKLPYTITKK